MLSARGFSSSSQVGDSSKFPAGEVKDARDAHGATKPALVDKVNDKKNVADSKFDSNPIHYLGFGVEHFKDRRLRDHFYCDKSHLIRTLEKGNKFILCRPRRLGKTTFINMLHEYYDWRNRDQKGFDKVGCYSFFLSLFSFDCINSPLCTLFRRFAALQRPCHRRESHFQARQVRRPKAGLLWA